MNAGDLIYNELDTITAFDLLTGEYLFTLDELQSATIANTQETSDITGKQGRKLSTLKKNKGVTVSGTNGVVSRGLAEIQVGSDTENKVSAVLFTETISVTGDKATTKYKAVGTVGNEIGTVYVTDTNSITTAKFTQGSAVGENVFTYDPATKAIAFKSGAVADGTEVVVRYFRQVSADVLSNVSDSYSRKVILYIDLLAEDACSKTYHVQFQIPKADFSGEFSWELGGDQTTHAFEATSLAGSCGSSGNLWKQIVFGEDADDAA